MSLQHPAAVSFRLYPIHQGLLQLCRLVVHIQFPHVQTKIIYIYLHRNQGELMVHTSKIHPTEDCSFFQVLRRVMSSKLHTDYEMRVLGEVDFCSVLVSF